MKSIVVLPTIRGKRIKKWLVQWKKELADSILIIVEDNPQKTFQVKKTNVVHYSWEDIDNELGKNSWIIPRRTAAIRSFGFWKAYQSKPDLIISLDDDCYPDDKNFVSLHYKYLQKTYPWEWTQHTQGDIKVRGFPKKLEEKECILNMGLWSNIPDLSGETQKKYPKFRIKKQNFNFPLTKGQFAPICGMNVAFKPKIIPAYYYLLMGKQWGFDRFEDIWAGIFLKKIANHLGYVFSGGEPFVRHDQASDPKVNIRKEKNGLKVNEFLWKDVQKIKLSRNKFKDCYIELASQLSEYSKYWKRLKQAMNIWANLF